MHNQFSPEFNQTPDAKEAEAILLRCVHCGFCNATCPTYQLRGDELDGPRGRIYLIKQLLEGNAVSENTQVHLDRCLSCRSCETTCPSGVKYGRLLDIGREFMEHQVPRSWLQRGLRQALMSILPYPERFKRMTQLNRFVRPLLPAKLKNKLPALKPGATRPALRHMRRVLMLEGCVQPALAPHINDHVARLLDRIGISTLSLPNAGCCGALNLHLNDKSGAEHFMRRMIDANWPHIEDGIEAIIMSASGCVSTLKDYAWQLRNDPLYAEKAVRFSEHCLDLSELLRNEDLSTLSITPRKIAFQSPCSLQHGQQLNGVVETLLTKQGFKLAYVNDAHLCCGSAGSYSILQPDIADQLRMNKLRHLQHDQPDLIATANIGCLVHLQEKSGIPVVHWIELFDLPIT